jgi:hypothetical protein
MRVGVWAAAGLCALAVAVPARAQNQSNPFAATLSGVQPSAITFKPIDMSTMVVNPAQSTTQGRFTLTSLFKRFTIPGFPTTKAVMPLPDPSSFPTYPSAKMVGTPPTLIGNPDLSKSPFQPAMPTTMTLPGGGQ